MKQKTTVTTEHTEMHGEFFPNCVYLRVLRGREKKSKFEKCTPLFSITYRRKIGIFPIFSHVPCLRGEEKARSGPLSPCQLADMTMSVASSWNSPPLNSATIDMTLFCNSSAPRCL